MNAPKSQGNGSKRGNFSNFDEVTRLRYTIARFKEYDRKRKTYLRNLEHACENYRNKIKEYEALTERQHYEIDELMNAYENSKPLIDNPSQKAYVYELLHRIDYLKPFEKLYKEAVNECQSLNARITELEQLIKSLRADNNQNN